MEKAQFVINDFLLFEEFCNLRCDYCGGFYPTDFVFRRDGDRLVYPQRWESTRKASTTLEEMLDQTPKITQLFELASRVLEGLNDQFEYPILKLSGGEVFLIKEICDFIEHSSKRFKAVQLLTNGTLLNESSIECIAQLGNVYIQLSLDGHNLEVNRARIKREELQRKILRNIEVIQKKGLSLEINCVLTKYNTKEFSAFAEYISQYPKVVIFPRPVRGESVEILHPDESAIKQFEESIKTVNPHVLPPSSYIDKLLSTLLHKKRAWKCYIPFFVMGTDMYGNLSRCTLCSGSTKVTNILEPDEDKLQSLKHKVSYNSDNNCISCPENCITQYEMFNLYVESMVNEEELKKVPIFRANGIIENIKEIKSSIKK
ncbi:radical SAM protein [Candidatus Woesearchaeota archaeon]|nr:radical SAM protein [Candidatus Woesearchaeota archaeon]